MTGISTLRAFVDDEMQEFLDSKANPDEWYVLTGSMVGEYSVHADYVDEDYEDFQEELPPEERDATENVEGYMQIGMQGWLAEAFDDDANFVGEFAGSGFDKLDPRLLGILVVHEDMLCEEALDIAKEGPAKA